MKRLCTAVVTTLALLLVPAAVSTHDPAQARPGAAAAPTPVLAYYYIWFNASSWNRAKRDFPTAGRYTSDEVTIMRRHVRAAKAAGITGFLVSWKDTPQLDARLDKLVQVAAQEHFTLGIVYQGLDVRREPLPVARVRADLVGFAKRWGANPVFDLFGRPLVVWAGTWRFSTSDIRLVSREVRPRLQLLASERQIARWSELGPLVDGNAYYWSSVDLTKETRATSKLVAMGQAVHSTSGLWIPSAAPGFDARLIGGTRVVGRNNGTTLKQEWASAAASSPDALGLISWNEFTEGTYVEPSRQYGDVSLRTVAALTQTRGPQGELDSSSPTGRSSSGPWRAALIGGLLLLLVLSALVRVLRGSRSRVSRRGAVSS